MKDSQSDYLPPEDASPGDKWGAYVMCDDGWWRLDSESELAWWRISKAVDTDKGK